MIKLFLIRCFLIALFALPISVNATETPVAAFAKMPTFTDLEISPGGKFVAARLFRGDRYIVSLFKLVDGSIEYVYGFTENETFSISWFEWVSPDRLVFSAAFTGMRGGVSRVQTQERRLMVINAETTDIRPLFRNRADEVPIQIQDRIVSFLPKDPKHILVQYSVSDPQTPNVYRVNVTKTSRHVRVVRGRSGVRWWMADSDGDVRLGEGVKNSQEPYLTIRNKDDDKWTNFSHRLQVPGVTFDPVGFSSEPGQLYVRSNHEGDPLGLYSFDIATDTFGPLIYRHEAVDVSSVNIDEQTGQLLSVNFVDDEVETVRLAERPIRESIRNLHKQFPDHQLSTRSISSDGAFAVLRFSEQGRAGNYFLYDGLNNRAISLPPQYPDLVGVPLGQTIPTDYVARDGLVIPAFVTLPAGYESLDDAENLPFVIHPHGGPGAPMAVMQR